MRKKLYKSGCTLLLAAILSAPVSACPADAIYLVTKAVAAECPEASYGVQIALAAVIFNRMEDPRFGDTAAQVVWSDGFLNCVRTGRIMIPPDPAVWDQVYSAVTHAAEGMDPTGGAVWYGSTPFRGGVPCYADKGYVFYR